MFSIEQTFNLIVQSVPNTSAQSLAQSIRTNSQITDGTKFEESPYLKTPFDESLPSFDKGYMFKFLTDNKYVCKLDILEKNMKIMQVGMSILVPRGLIFSKSIKIFNKIKALANNYYIDIQTMEHMGVKILKYDGLDNIAYLNNIRVGSVDTVRFNVGNKEFYS